MNQSSETKTTPGTPLTMPRVLEMIAKGKITSEEGYQQYIALREKSRQASVTPGKQPVNTMYYHTQWQEARISTGKLSADPFLLFDVNEKQQELIKAQTARVALVKPGKKFQDLGNDRYEINPHTREDYVQLVAALKEKDLLPGDILHLWSLDREPARVKHTREYTEEVLTRGVYSIYYLVRAYALLKLDLSKRFIYIYSEDEEDPEPLKEAVSGFSPSLAFIYPHLLFSPVCIPAAGTKEPLEDIIQKELGITAREQQIPGEIRYRAGTRYVKKVEPLPGKPAPGNVPGLKEGGVYLITGGCGGLGLTFARYMAGKYHARLVLTGRTPPQGKPLDSIAEMKRTGADVVYHQADAAKKEEMKQVIKKIKEKFGRINGVIHAAGILGKNPIKDKEIHEFKNTLEAKIQGTMTLDQVTGDEKLDFFVLFSSAASILGDFGQCDYAVGNRFMDAYARKRENLRKKNQRRGQTLSINWPLWREGGMHAHQEGERLYLESSGLDYLETAAGLQAFEHTLATGKEQVMILTGNKKRINQFLKVEEEKPGQPPGEKQTNTPTVLKDQIQKEIKHIAAALLKLDPQKIEISESLGNYGFDSIMLKDFTLRLKNTYQIEISPTIFFQQGNIQRLSQYLLEEFEKEIRQYYNKVETRSEPGAGLETQETAEAADPGTREKESIPRLTLSSAGREEDIAIIGASGIFPGTGNLEEFWRELAAGKDLISQIPAERWDWQAYIRETGIIDESMVTKWGGFIPDVDKFDARFFNISRREAEMMDPQQRLILQSTWHTFEDAGYKVSYLSGRPVGIFIGAETNDYRQLMMGTSEINPHIGTGNHNAMLANRISYILNLRGASETINTACSSSLTAMSHAVQSLQSRHCEMAIVGGVTLILSPYNMIGANTLGILSPAGRCKTFDKDANGYVKGEGVGTLLLKPLGKAVTDNDHIYAVIKGIAVNHGGKANSLTAPNSEAQAALLIDAYENAGISPDTLTYIEVHGTGTELGDPVEIDGIKKAFKEISGKLGKKSEKNHYCGLGTVKTNIGHLEAASGMAGVIKVLLAMKHKTLPGILHLKEMNPYIDLRDTPFYVVKNTQPWNPLTDTRGKPIPRRAGVSSFGFGGSNVHVVLEEYQAPPATTAIPTLDPHIIILSAKNKERLEEYARDLLDFLEKNTKTDSTAANWREQSPDPAMQQEIQTYIKETLSGILNVPGKDLHTEEEITGYGIDPVQLSKVAGQINQTYNLDITTDQLAGQNTIRSLARYIWDRCREKDLHTRPCPLRLEDIAYTLQMGRESLEERIAMIVTGIEEIKEKLHRYTRGEIHIDNFYRGNAKENREKLDTHLLLEGEEGKLYIKNLRQKGKLDKIARCWAAGMEIDWEITAAPREKKPRRISLPLYPFARERYWLSQPGDGILAAGGQQPGTARLHPLIDRNISDFTGQKFTTRLKENEFYIKDHELGSQKILPGTVLIEMVRAAAEISGKARVQKIKKITWVKPTPINEKTNRVQVRLLPHPPAKPGQGPFTVEFEVSSDKEDSPPLLRASGTLVYHQPAFSGNPREAPGNERVDIETTKARCDRTLEGFAAYRLLQSMGLSYGPGMRPLQVMNYNETEALARLQLPAALNVDYQAYTLHPTLLEGALQILRLWTDKNAGKPLSHGLYWPYQLGEIELMGTIPADCYVYTRLTGNNHNKVGEKTFNICFMDTAGQVVVKMKEMQLKTITPVNRPEQIKPVETGDLQPASIYYRGVWEPASLPDQPGEEEEPPGPILLFDENEELRDAVTRQPKTGTVILVKPGTSFQKKADNLYEINPLQAADYNQLIDTLEKQGGIPGKIVHLWSRQEWTNHEEAVEQQLIKSIYSLFFLTRTLMEQKPGKDLRLLYLFFQPSTDDNHGFQPQYAGISAFARTIRLENPRFIYKTIQLASPGQTPGELPSTRVAGILKEFSAAHQEVEIKYDISKNQRYVKRLQLIANRDGNNLQTGDDSRSPIQLKDKGVYLITGGLGGLGQIFARYLVRNFNVRLILTGRSHLSNDKENRAAGIKEITVPGSEVIYLQADLSRRREVTDLVKEIKKRFGQIHGVLHCAGVTRDAYALKKTGEQIKEVLAAKVYGTLYLDEALKEENLDFFIMFSSLSAVMGNVGQCDYAYANSFMDGFVQWREALRRNRERCGATISINWPYWQEGGMELPREERARLEELTGAAGIPTEKGIKAFEKVLRENISRCVLFYGIRPRVEQAVTQIFSPVSNRKTGAPTPKTTPLTVNKEELSDKTGKFLQSLLAEILKLPKEQIEPAARFEELGIDSLVINMFNAKFVQEFFPVPRTLLFENQTLEELTAYFVRSHPAELVNLFKIKEKEPLPLEPPAVSGEETPAAWPGPLSLEEKYAHGTGTPLEYGPAPVNRQEDIAIIGISGRYPAAKDLEEFWENLKHGKDCIIEIPAGRWDYRDYFDPDPKKGMMYSKWGGFLEEIDKFEPLLFNISPREAALMDPQERIFLETVRATLEDAGYTKDEIKKTIKKEKRPDIGLFVGTTTYSYYILGQQGSLERELSYPWSIANRVSFAFNFQGPSMPVDTACSSSLTALHLACESLKKQECSMAIVGGVNLYLHPSKYLGMCTMQMLSPTGKCHTFGKEADGFVPGEGVGALLLKPLSAALKEHDHIYAVIKGTAINHGGRTNGFTVPNPRAQASLILQALENSRIDPRTISYIEAHGTGTALGDPVEIQGLTLAYQEYTRDKQFCSIGSAKSNIGHLESAAGIAGITKIILQMKHRQLAPSLHARDPNPNIEFEKTPFYVQQRLAHWQQPVIKQEGEERTCPRRAAVSSFGAGGSNAHIILEEFTPSPSPAADRHQDPQLIILSAREEEQLKEYAGKIAKYLARHRTGREISYTLSDIAYTLQKGREPMNWRIAFTAAEIKEIEQKLTRYASGQTGIEAFYRGNAKDNKILLENLFKGKAGEEYIETLVKNRDLQRLAQMWIFGISIPWDMLYPGARPGRITLPTYPFAGQRYWKPDPALASVPHEPGRNQPSINDKIRANRGPDRPKSPEPAEETGDPLGHFFYRPIWELSPSYRNFHFAAGWHTRHHPETNENLHKRFAQHRGSPRRGVSSLPMGAAAPDQEEETVPGTTILVIYPSPAAPLEKALERVHTGSHLEKIEMGTQNRQKSPNHWEIDTADPLSLHRQISRFEHLDTIYFLGGITGKENQANDNDIDRLEQYQQYGLLSLFRLIKSLDQQGKAQKSLQIKVITNDVLPVENKNPVIPYGAGLHGLAGTMAREYTRWRTICVDLSREEIAAQVPAAKLDALARALQRETSQDPGEPVAIRQGKRYQRKIQSIILPPVKQNPYRQKGVYLILGGAGGIGLELGHCLAQKVQARLILLGRRQQDQLQPQQKEKIKEIRASGGEVIYIQADATDPVSMKAAVDQARSRFGQINGVVHSAIVLKDKTLANMDEETFQAAAAPKIKGSIVLYEVVKDQPLDFMMFFSSTQSFSNSPGQGNYAAGSTFKDAFALYLEQKTTYPVKIINWGYWGSVGIVSTEEYNQRLTKQGLYSIIPREGMETVHRVLVHQVRQVIAIKAEARLKETMVKDPHHRVIFYPPQIPSLVEPVIQHTREQMKTLAEEIDKIDIKSYQEGFTALRHYMNLLLLHVFQQMKVFQQTNQRYDKEKLRRQLKVVPQYNRLYEALLDILHRAELIHQDGDIILTSLEPEQEYQEENYHTLEKQYSEIIGKYPRHAAYIKLAKVCLQAYPQILTGKKSHMEVMFPGGTPGLVEPIYEAHQVVGIYNRLTAGVVETYIRQRLQENSRAKIRVLEASQKYAGNISHYYTDIPGKLIPNAKGDDGAEYPDVKVKVLDIEKNPRDQGYEMDSIDLVIAVNVLHAARDIEKTLGQIKKLLKTNGLLVINEAAVRDDFSTLTFGLIPGWWLYRDQDRRIRHTPLLSQAQWRQALENTGFRHIHILNLTGETGDEARLSVITAESSGQVEIQEPEQKQKKSLSTPRAKPITRPQTPPIYDEQGDDNLEEVIKDILCQFLQIEKVKLDPGAPFQDYGVDSLLAVEIIDRINEKLNLELRATDLYNYSTIRDLTGHIGSNPGYHPADPGPVPTRETLEFSMQRDINPGQGRNIKKQPGNHQNTNQLDRTLMELIQRLHTGEIDIEEADQMLGGMR